MTRYRKAPKPLEIRNLEAWIPGFPYPHLTGANVSLVPGEVAVVMGPSGAGKTTLLNAVLNEIIIANGTVTVCGEKVVNGQALNPEHYGFVPQDTFLDGKLTVWQTVELAALARLGEPRDKEQRRKLVRDLLSKLGIEDVAETKVGKVSGGERRRVSVAVELVSSPPLLILDEPTNGVDNFMIRELYQTFRTIADSVQQTAVLFITHETTHLDLVDKIIAVGKVAADSKTATIRFVGTRNETLKHFGVKDIYGVIAALYNPPPGKAPEPSARPDDILSRTYITLDPARSFHFNLLRQWMRIGGTLGLVAQTVGMVVVGFIIAWLLRPISLVGWGIDPNEPNPDFLTYASMMVLLLAFAGIVLPVMGTVNAWGFVRREQRWGVSARSSIIARMCVQVPILVACVVAAALFCLRFTESPTDRTILPQSGQYSSFWQLLILLLISALCSYCLGVLIGCLNTTTETAIIVTVGLIALMLIGGGFLFTWQQSSVLYLASFTNPVRSGIALVASNFNAQLVMSKTSDAAFRMSALPFYGVALGLIALSGLLLKLSMWALRYPIEQSSIAGRHSITTASKRILKGFSKEPAKARRQKTHLAAATIAVLVLVLVSVYSARNADSHNSDNTQVAMVATPPNSTNVLAEPTATTTPTPEPTATPTPEPTATVEPTAIPAPFGSLTFQEMLCTGTLDSIVDWDDACTPGASGASFTVMSAEGTVSRTLVPDGNGMALLDGLPPGSYTVDQNTAEWCRATGTRVNDETYLIVSAGDNTDVVIYQCVQEDPPEPTATVEPTATTAPSGSLTFQENLCTGTRDTIQNWKAACTPGSSGESFTVMSADGTVSQTHTPSADGVATFDDLPPGNYVVSQAPGDWCHAESRNLDAEGMVIVSDGENAVVKVYQCIPEEILEPTQTPAIFPPDVTPEDEEDSAFPVSDGVRYYDIGGEEEPLSTGFSNEVVTSPNACSLNGTQDFTLRYSSNESGDGYPGITVPATPNQSTSISLCIDHLPANDWQLWLGLPRPEIPGCSDRIFARSDGLANGMNVITFDIAPQCVSGDVVNLVFIGTPPGVYGVFVLQNSEMTDRPPPTEAPAQSTQNSIDADQSSGTDTSGQPPSNSSNNSDVYAPTEADYVSGCHYSWSSSGWVESNCDTVGTFYNLGPPLPVPLQDGCYYLFDGVTFHQNPNLGCEWSGHDRPAFVAAQLFAW